MIRKFAIAASALLLTVASYGAEQKDTLPKPSVTEGSIMIKGRKIEYSAETGYMSLKDDNLKHIANVFYIAYRKKGEPADKRPVSFCFNGGPGSSSAWLHIGALGPKRILTDNTGAATPPPHSLVDNEYSWLDLTDLVFIDPVGTGFSRPAEGADEKQFYGYANDIKAVSEFIRQYLNKTNTWASPKYLVGESYGTTRAVGVSKYLIEEHGIYVNGISLISAVLDFQTLREYAGNDLPNVCNLPVFSATAAYYGKVDMKGEKLPQFLARSERFALNEYQAALSKGRTIAAAEKDAIADSLVRYTGMSKEFILKSNLRVPSYRFRKQLLNDKHLNVGRFDTKMTIDDTDPAGEYGDDDASYVFIKGAFSSCFNSYVRGTLKYNNDLPYKLIGGVSPWNYANGQYLNVVPELERSLVQNPQMKVWVANGYYDLATSYFGTQYAVSKLFVPDSLFDNISMTYYYGGHMMYLHYSELVKLKTDAEVFYR